MPFQDSWAGKVATGLVSLDQGIMVKTYKVPLCTNCLPFCERRVIRDEALSNCEMSFLLGNEEGYQLDICSLLAGYQSHRRSVG